MVKYSCWNTIQSQAGVKGQKMKEFKKIIFFILALCLITGTFTGCIAAGTFTGRIENKEDDKIYTVKFNLVYNLDGQEIQTTVNGQTEVEDITIKAGNNFLGRLPKVDKRDDYLFRGWYYISGDKQILVSEAVVFDPTIFGGKNDIITLTALWSRGIVIKYDLLYKINNKEVQSTVNGKTFVPNGEIQEGMTFSGLLPKVDDRPYEDDYYFSGWVCEIGGKQVKITEEKVFTMQEFFGQDIGNEITLLARVDKAWFGPY